MGSKRRLLNQILPLFPDNIHTFYDLFAGGGVVSLNTNAKYHVWNDLNKPLVDMFRDLSTLDEVQQFALYNPQMRTGFKSYHGKTGSKTSNYGSFTSIETINHGERYPVKTLNYSVVPHTIHPTQKPVKLLEYLIKTYTNEGMTVLDNTMGSGSTGVAAKNLNRNFIGIELDKKYFEIAKQRIEEA